MTKAVFFDLDGTLVSMRTHKLSPAVLEALKRLRARGIKLFLSTGRHYRMLSYIRSHVTFDGYVTLSGQYCFCGDKVLRSSPMDRQVTEELVAAARANDFSCLFLEGEEMYINFVDGTVLDLLNTLDLPLPPVADPARALEGELYQALAFLSPERESLLLGRAPHLKTTRWHPSFLDILPPAGGKDKGVDAILEHFGIPPEESMAFGDGENDLSMLVHAGIGVAMGSASQAVRERADYVTGTAEEDGVVSALEHFGLI